VTAVECLLAAKAAGGVYQRFVNAFVDDYRRATIEARQRMVADPIASSGPLEGLVAGVVSALCRETEARAPAWVESVSSPEPFFGMTARSFAMRLRLMVESPAPFRIRNVFVPEDYLSRA
jgi:hypothetical protein